MQSFFKNYIIYMCSTDFYLYTLYSRKQVISMGFELYGYNSWTGIQTEPTSLRSDSHSILGSKLRVTR